MDVGQGPLTSAAADAPSRRIGRSIEHRLKGVVLAQAVEIRILPRLRAIFGIQGDSALQMLQRLVRTSLDAERRRHHVMRVVVVSVGGERPLQMPHRAAMVARIQRNGGRIDVVPRRLWWRRLAVGLAFADAEIQPGALEQLPLLGISLDYGSEQVGSRGVLAALKGLYAPLVDGDGFVEAGLSRWCRGRSRRGRR